MKALGKYVLFIGSLFTRRETFKTYIPLIFDECYKVGYKSIFIVALVSSFIGAVTTIQTAYNLVSPLIPDYVISLVVRDMTVLEIAPTIIAIIYAGKVGSNIAGELGTMRITEQIDALEVMGVNASSYLVLPKVIASFLMFPLLVILAAFLSIAGGYIAGTATGVITGYEYSYGLRFEFIPFTVTFALIKSFFFGFIVVSIASFKGFYTQGGALEVGIASTSAVTNSCIAILITDYLLAYLLLGI